MGERLACGGYNAAAGFCGTSTQLSPCCCPGFLYSRVDLTGSRMRDVRAEPGTRTGEEKQRLVWSKADRRPAVNIDRRTIVPQYDASKNQIIMHSTSKRRQIYARRKAIVLHVRRAKGLKLEKLCQKHTRAEQKRRKTGRHHKSAPRRQPHNPVRSDFGKQHGGFCWFDRRGLAMLVHWWLRKAAIIAQGVPKAGAPPYAGWLSSAPLTEPVVTPPSGTSRICWAQTSAGGTSLVCNQEKPD
ncbi:hypothetical protein BGZ60DRAFT_432315 [Tricladium varicosporioides]|nr:hypothetical protein BGZ60DRAFT_432315 [Hymenoscyphus varicosporioides]